MRSYNPELVHGITPPATDDYGIKLPYPIDTLQFTERLENVLESERRVRSVITYKVKKRDTLPKIAKKYGITNDDIQLVNNCEEELQIKPGMTIAIPKFTGPSKTVVAKNLDKEASGPVPRGSVKADKENAQIKSEKTRPHHIVKRGETIASISDKYSTGVVDRKSTKKIKNGKAYPNTKLKLAGYVEKKSVAKVKYHIVKKGETLDSISDKYGVGIGTIKSANRLKNNKIQARTKLKIVGIEG